MADPNPRLQLMIDAARRGAGVRLLLDSDFDDDNDPRSNRATADYLHALTAAKGLDMQARLANLAGGEISHKLNREVMVMTDLSGVSAQPAEMFLHDWGLVTR